MDNQPTRTSKFTNKKKENLDLFLESLKNQLFSEIKKIFIKNSKNKIQVVLLLKINRRNGDYCFRKLKTKCKNITVNSNLNNIFCDYIKCNLHMKTKCLTKNIKDLKSVEIIHLNLYKIFNYKCKVGDLCFKFKKMRLF